MISGQLIGHNSFDILNLEETQSSLFRSPTMVRLSYKDENNKLIQYVKTTPSITAATGDYLVAYNGLLMPTADRQSVKTVAKLLASPSTATQSKTVQIGLINHTALLLPVQLI